MSPPQFSILLAMVYYVTHQCSTDSRNILKKNCSFFIVRSMKGLARICPLQRLWHGCVSSHQSVCWSSMTRSILALPDPPARSAASDSVAAAAAVVCLTALEMEEKKPEPPPAGCGWLLDRRRSPGPGDTAGLCCGGSGRCRSVM